MGRSWVVFLVPGKWACVMFLFLSLPVSGCGFYFAWLIVMVVPVCG